MYMTRPKSTTAKRRTSSSGATIANSTNDWLRCDRHPAATMVTLEASNDHVGVHRDMHRVAQYAGHEPGCKSDRKSTRLNSSHLVISYAVFCLKKKINYM